MNKVSNKSLVEAGISAMEATGRLLKRVPMGSRAMIYGLENGETVRIRTCNDHVLVAVANSPDESANLNIEGTDHLLIVVPEVQRSEGPVICYFIPTSIAVAAVRQSHAEWLKRKPATKGENRTWTIFLDSDDGPCSGFALKWQRYRLPASQTVLVSDPRRETGKPISPSSLGAVIADAKKAIADAAGVSIDAVKISVVLD